MCLTDNRVGFSQNCCAGTERRAAQAARAHAARTVARNASTSRRRRSDCFESSLAEPSTCVAAEPTCPDACVTPEMLAAISLVPRAAWLTLLAISCVAARCSSTAEAMVEAISLTRPMVARMPWMAATASLVAPWIESIWPAISSVALAVWLARLFTSLATTAKPLPCSPARAAAIELVGDAVKRGLLRGSRPYLLLFLLEAKAIRLDHVGLEHADRACHGANLVAPLRLRNKRRGIAVGQHRHRRGESAYRTHDAASDRPSAEAEQSEQADRPARGVEEAVAENHIDVIGIDAPADHPIPGLYAERIAEPRRWLPRAGAPKQEGDEAAALLRRLDELGVEAHAVGVLELQQVLALVLRLEPVRDVHTVVAIGVEIVALAEMHRAQRRLGALLRLGVGDAAELRLLA